MGNMAPFAVIERGRHCPNTIPVMHRITAFSKMTTEPAHLLTVIAYNQHENHTKHIKNSYTLVWKSIYNRLSCARIQLNSDDHNLPQWQWLFPHIKQCDEKHSKMK
jgi:hypothetical protein